MRIQVWNAIPVATSAAGLLAAADTPYAGKWKMNTAKSDFGESTMTYEQMPNGETTVTMDGPSYTFKTDGKENPTPWGMTVAVKAIDGKTWEMLDRANGKVINTTTMKLSTDDKTLTLDSKRVKANGEMTNDSMTMQRVSGGPGLAGKWKMKKLNSSAPSVLDLSAKSADSLTITMDEKNVCDAKFDGKDYPATGPGPSGWSCSIAKSGAHGFDVTWKKDGKAMYKSTLAASADGKTLIESGSAVGVAEKFKIVYDRQ